LDVKLSTPLLPHSQERMTQVRQLSSLLPYSKCNPVYSENSTGPSVVGEFKRDNANALQHCCSVGTATAATGTIFVRGSQQICSIVQSSVSDSRGQNGTM